MLSLFVLLYVLIIAIFKTIVFFICAISVFFDNMLNKIKSLSESHQFLIKIWGHSVTAVLKMGVLTALHTQHLQYESAPPATFHQLQWYLALSDF